MGVVKYTGPVASFHCPTNAEIRSLKVHFSPKQEGTGDPSPENVRPISGWTGCNVYRTGKNLFDADTVYAAYKIGENSFEAMSNVIAQVHYYIPQELVGKQLTFSVYLDLVDLIAPTWFKCRANVNGSKIAGNSIYANDEGFTSVTFTPISTNDYIDFIWGSGKGVIKFKDFMLEIGSPRTTYEPYQGSTTNYEFGVLGKNKLDPTWESGGINVSTGEALTDSASIRLKNMIKVFPSQTYRLSWSSTGRNIYRFAYKKDGTFSRYLGLQSANSQSITLNADEYYLWLYQYQNVNEPESIQLELGDTATEYEPYNPKHTVYGGWVDLISGEVCETNIVYTGGWVQYAESNGYKRYELTNILLGDQNNLQNISNITTLFSNISSSTKDNRIQPVSQGSVSIRAYLSLDENIDADSVQYGYKLATPNTYHIAPTAIQTFLGQNNVWSNADYVEVEYDLHETQDILARKQFIMANQPHVVTSAAAPLQNFTTDVVASLKECKAHFGPVQSGSGDPNPDNVRPIRGWTNLNITQTGKNLFGGAALINKFSENGILPNTTNKTLTYTGSQANSIGKLFDKFSDGQYSIILHYTSSNESAPNANMRLWYKDGSYLSISTNQAVENNGDYHRFLTNIDKTINYLEARWVAGTIILYYEDCGIFKGNVLLSDFVPYSNTTIPITFPATTNLFNEQWEQGNIEVGNDASSSTCMRTGFIDVNSSTSYYLYTPRENNVFVFEYLEDGTYADKVNSVYTSHTFTTGSTTKKIRIVDRNSGTETVNTGINYPATITYYEPYGTVYGGNVDLVSGELVAEWNLVDLGTLNWERVESNTSGIYYFRTTSNVIPAKYYSGDGMKLHLMSSAYVTETANRFVFGIASNNSIGVNDGLAVRVRNDAFSDSTNFKTAMSGVQLAYELATPITYQLTPPQLKSLRGINNIWSNAGDVSVSYWTH